jgi:hypothetical protein
MNAPLAEPGARIVAIIRSYKGPGIARWGRVKGEDTEGVSAMNGHQRREKHGGAFQGCSHRRGGQKAREPDYRAAVSRVSARTGVARLPETALSDSRGNGRAGDVTSEWRSVEAAAPHVDALYAQPIVAQHDEKAQVCSTSFGLATSRDLRTW